MRSKSRIKLTPPEVAQRWGISPEKVITWIRSGELRALNAATRPGGRPRYLIDEADLAEFESRRSVQPVNPKRHRKRNTSPNIIEFFK
jgi:excisionase family DNA binding protein